MKAMSLSHPAAIFALASLLAVSTVGAAAIEADFVWRVQREHAGKSSPRTADLNGDGFPDVLVGTGYEHFWGEAVAIDGKTGDVLWSRRFADEVLVTLPVVDVNGDGVRDVIVGGRVKIGDLFALNGLTGETLWRLTEANAGRGFLPTNFINVVPVDDRDGDEVPDLLVVQSGGQDARRPAARFHWVASATGRVLATAVAPDGKESYAMPLHAGPDRFYIGTGGETLSGGLFKVADPGLEVQWRAPSLGGGFIASPLLTDVDGDGADDLIAAGMNGGVYRIDAGSGDVAWEWRERPHWSYVSPAVGQFGGDATLDVLAGLNRGRWPRRDQGRLLWLDGATGRVLSEKRFDERSRSTAASPLVLDVDGDGRDEILIVFSNPVPDVELTDETHVLVLFGGDDDRSELLRLDLEGYSIATPHVSDLDGDGKLDVIHASHHGVMRIELSSPVNEAPQVRWGELRGPGGRGVYRP
jgi:outer membrane protein assembly factor BamB